MQRGGVGRASGRDEKLLALEVPAAGQLYGEDAVHKRHARNRRVQLHVDTVLR